MEGCTDCGRKAAEMSPDSFLGRLHDVQGGCPRSQLEGILLEYPRAALYRAGRFEDAIRRREEGIQLVNNGRSTPQDWGFLAMAHHHLGHRDLARDYLRRLGSRQPSTDTARCWDEIEVRLLQNEAEAVILCDPTFPADPFAH